MPRTPRAAELLPPLRWLRGYRRGDLAADAIAGLTVAVMLVPQAMAFAVLAGLPPVHGLYAAAVPVAVYALLGTSAHLAVGPAAIICLLTASAVTPLSGGDPARHAALAALLALLVAAIHLAMGLARLGALVNLLSEPVISGFVSAAGLVIAASQLPALLGLPRGGTGFLDTLTAVAGGLGEAHPATLALGAAALVALLAGRLGPARLPVPLLVLVAATVATGLLGLDVATVGEVPAGLPAPVLPPLDADAVVQLLPAALAIALVAYAENVSLAKATAARARARIDPNQELLASGAANLAAGLFRAFPVAASFSRTGVNVAAGARTQMASVVAAAGVALTALVATPLFTNLPDAALAAIIVVAALGLVDVRSAAHAWRTDRGDGLMLTATVAATLLVGIEEGLVVGVAIGIVVLVWRGARPHTAELGRVEGTTVLRNVERYPTRIDPRVAILRIDGPLHFASANRVADLVRALPAQRRALEAVVLDCSAIPSVDVTGAEALTRAGRDLADAGVALHLATVRGPVRDALRRAGSWPNLEGRVHPDVASALEAAGIDRSSPLLAPDPDEEAPEGLW